MKFKPSLYSNVEIHEILDHFNAWINSKRTIKVYGKTKAKESKTRRSTSGRKQTVQKAAKKIKSRNKKTA